jgi:hypothetical protein
MNLDLEKAFHILEIDTNDHFTLTLDDLKKKYHKLALKNHPDKNGNTPASNERFSKINEAYHYILRERFTNLNTNNKEDNDLNDFFNKDFFNSRQPTNNYYDLLKQFIHGFQYNEYLTTLIEKCIQKSVQPLLDGLDRETCLKIYTFLSKHQSILHIDNHILNKWREMVQQKFADVLVYELNPSISDLLNNKLYKLNVDGNICFVPLWMRESYFDISGYEVIVLCQPDLPENIHIDEKNDMHVRLSIDICNPLVKKSIQENVPYFIKPCIHGEQVYEIPLSELYLKSYQIYTLEQSGICIANDNEYDDVSNKANIVFHIHMH